MFTITINVENEEDLALVAQEVADCIEAGYWSGLAGENGDSWYIEKDEEE